MIALTSARKAVDAGNLDRALEQLLIAWRRVPATEIADAITAVDARARALAPPLAGATGPQRIAAWTKLARDKDPVTTGVLIDALADPPQLVETARRIEVLVKRGTDPRLAAKLGDFIERPLYNANMPRTTAFWRRLFELLPALGDPRLIVRARGFPAIWEAASDLTPGEKDVLPKRFARAMPAIEDAYGDGPPALPAGDAATCAAICAAVARQADEQRAAFEVAMDARLEGKTSIAKKLLAEASEADLLGAIYAAPDDDQPRRDYAQWLHRRSDSLGELIDLQLARGTAGKASRDAARREKALLGEHKTRMLRGLAPMVKTSATFERGFVDRCALKGTWEQTFADDPAWSTVRWLELGNAGMIQLARITRPLIIEEIEWELRGGSGDDYGQDEAIAAFQRLKLPRLRRLRVFTRWAFYGRRDRTWIDDAPFAKQLTEVELEL